MLERHHTVAQLVVDHPECADVFHRHRIDFCCRGRVSLEQAAEDAGLDLDSLIAELSAAVARRHDIPRRDPQRLSTPRLIAFIVARHHEYLREALPFVGMLADKVSRVHGQRNPALGELRAAVNDLTAAILPHLDREEESLFPLLSAPGNPGPAAHRELATMEREHLEVADLLERIRIASGEFSIPDWACNSYRTLLQELAELDRDIRAHVHIENHVLAERFSRTGAHDRGATDGSGDGQ